MLLFAGCTKDETASSADGSAEEQQQSDDFANFPDFSWDTVPVCIHLGIQGGANITDYDGNKVNVGGEFTTEQLYFLSRFPLVCIEKSHGITTGVDQSMEYYALASADKIRALNPSSKVLFYWNSIIDYESFYEHTSPVYGDEAEHTDWRLQTSTGDYVYENNHYYYNFVPTEFREWWVSIPLKWCGAGQMDGVFVDKLPYFYSSVDSRKATYTDYDQLVAGLDDMLTQLKAQMLPDKFIIGNALRGASTVETFGMRFLTNDLLHGAMLEHFGAISSYNKDTLAQDIDLIAEAAAIGKSVVVKGWPEFNWLDYTTDNPDYSGNAIYGMYMTPTDSYEAEALAKDQITFPLACFLMGAGKYSYFCYSWGYDLYEGGMVDYPQYDRKLGEPLGAYTKDGYKYERFFEYANVYADLEEWTATIEWKDVTGRIYQTDTYTPTKNPSNGLSR